MADTLTQVSTLNNQLAHFFVPRALLQLVTNTPLYGLAEKANQPKGQGNATYWTAWIPLAGASSTLTEGTANSLPALSSRRVSATVSQHGRGYVISDLAEFVTVLSVREGAMQMLEQSAKETLEYICHRGIFKSSYFASNSKTTLLSAFMSSLASAFSANTGTNNNSAAQFQFPAIFATSAARLSAVSKTAPTMSAQLSMYGIRKAVNRLERMNARPRSDGYYIAYCHPNAIHSLRKDKNWEQWNQYTAQGQENMYKGEAGRIYRVRFITSSIAPRYAVTAHSVVPVAIFGDQAFGVTQALGGLEMFVASGADKSDPFNQVTKLTYKVTGNAACLNPSAGVILWVHELLS
jgi:N4-gp56 family major capsid protein